MGNYIVVEHTYVDGKRWTGYIHLAESPTVKVGDTVELGKQMGNARRGNTGVSNGEHLHLYLTKIVSLSTPYTWDNMLMNSIDPKPYLYYSKEFNTQFISSAWGNELKKIVYPTPVERNIWVHQIEVKSDTRRLRQGAALSARAYGEYCTKGIYNAKALTFVDDYIWALIDEIDGNKFWVAVMDGEDLPEKKIVYPSPVERDESTNQVEIKSDTRKLRAAPSLQGEIYDELCKRGVYDVIKWETANGYDWALIAQLEGNDFWVAVMAGEDLPITDYQTLYLKEKAKITDLLLQIQNLTTANEEATKTLTELQKTNAALIEETKTLAAVQLEVERLTKEAEEAQSLLAKTTTEAANLQQQLLIAQNKLQKIKEIL